MKRGVEDTVYAAVAHRVSSWSGEPGPALYHSRNNLELTVQMNDVLVNTTFSSASFPPGLRALEDFRAIAGLRLLAGEPGQPGAEFIVLKDAAFNSAVASVKQQISYINLLYLPVRWPGSLRWWYPAGCQPEERLPPCAAWAARFCSFFSFFEQSILCVLGLAVGWGSGGWPWARPSCT